MSVTILNNLERPFRRDGAFIKDANGVPVADCFNDQDVAAAVLAILNGRTLGIPCIVKLDAVLEGAESFISGFIGDEMQEEPVDDLVDAIQQARGRLGAALSIGREPAGS